MMPREPDNPEIKEAWAKSKEYSRNVIDNPEPGIYINDSQPRCGKTYNLAKVISETTRSIAFFTANHDHLDEFKGDLEEFGIYEGEGGYIHGKGFAREGSCLRYPHGDKKEKWTPDQELVHKIYNGFGVKSSRFLCNDCDFREGCEYYEYTHHSDNYRITLQPLEFLYTEYNDEDKDVFVVDETINKKETLFWDFNLEKLNQFISCIKKFTKKDYYALEDYIGELKKFHKTILQENSLIFTESPSTLFNMNDRTFKGKERERRGFLQNRKYITHPGKIRLSDSDSREDLFNLHKDLEGIIKYTDNQIRDAIKEKDSIMIDNMIENYIPLWRCSQIFEILIYNAFKEVYFLVSEKLTEKPIENLHPGEKIKIEGDFEYGFTSECFPYIHNTETGECVVSEMGKSYESPEKHFEKLHDAWFTLGRPFLFQVFNKSEEKPILFLDATHNDKIFDKLHHDWSNSLMIKKAVIDEQQYPIIEGGIKPRIERQTITNPNSILYVVDSRGNSNYPKSSLIKKDGKVTKTLEKVIGSIITIIEENPDKKIATISRIDIEKILNHEFRNIKSAHYYNLRGMNITSDILACIGTPYVEPTGLLYDYILTFNEFPKDTTSIETDKKFEGYKDEELNNFFESKVFEESYQGLHRNAPLIWNRENYLFGEVPVRIEAELTVKHVKLDDVCGRYIFEVMELFIENKCVAWGEIYNAIRRWKIFDKKYEPRHFLDELEEMGLVTTKIERTRTNKKLMVYFTRKARYLYKKYVKIYGVTPYEI